ncbi:Trm112 family protein [Gallaecimonas mangrovi]|uniref:Trm112 family protein n=1 Tax=Gallaecimonas mangrovi TaxID=2291597 RepID=UPI000E1FD973|nr:Trm112 family protein [Gallaecimonas mangrovi]
MAFDKRLLDVVACPLCKGKLKLDEEKQELCCHFDKLAYPIRGDIPVMLPDEARKMDLDEVLP